LVDNELEEGTDIEITPEKIIESKMKLINNDYD